VIVEQNQHANGGQTRLELTAPQKPRESNAVRKALGLNVVLKGPLLIEILKMLLQTLA
jgi:hypothetical protein